MNISLPQRGQSSPSDINASSQSLINTLLQQASKSSNASEKKRPTFEEVFAKLNARSARMDANKNPINNMLTNEQLFRYYIKETQPKLQISDETFSSEELFNPMKESDPTKTYGSATTLTSDIAQALNPANNLPNVGLDYPPDLRTAPAPAPRKVPTQSRMPTDEGGVAGAPIITQGVLLDVVLGEADNNYRDALAISNRLQQAKYDKVSGEGDMLLKILFSDDYQDQSVYFMKQLIDGGGVGLENAVSGLFDIFYQTRLNKPTNNFITNRIKDIVGSTVLQDEFNKLYNPNNVSQQEFLQNIAKKVNSSAFFNDREKARFDRELAVIDLNPLGVLVGDYVDNAEKTYYDLYGMSARTATSSALVVGRVPEGTSSVIDPVVAFNTLSTEETNNAISIYFNELLDGMFNDDDTQLRTNTDINRTDIDPQIVGLIAGRINPLTRPSPLQLPTIPASPSASSSSTIAEAESAGVDIDNVIGRRGRGVQPGDVRGPYEKTRKKTAASTLQAAIRRGLEQPAAKGSV